MRARLVKPALALEMLAYGVSLGVPCGEARTLSRFSVTKCYKKLQKVTEKLQKVTKFWKKVTKSYRNCNKMVTNQ